MPGCCCAGCSQSAASCPNFYAMEAQGTGVHAQGGANTQDVNRAVNVTTLNRSFQGLGAGTDVDSNTDVYETYAAGGSGSEPYNLLTGSQDMYGNQQPQGKAARTYHRRGSTAAENETAKLKLDVQALKLQVTRHLRFSLVAAGITLLVAVACWISVSAGGCGGCDTGGSGSDADLRLQVTELQRSHNLLISELRGGGGGHGAGSANASTGAGAGAGGGAVGVGGGTQDDVPSTTDTVQLRLLNNRTADLEAHVGQQLRRTESRCLNRTAKLAARVDQHGVEQVATRTKLHEVHQDVAVLLGSVHAVVVRVSQAVRPCSAAVAAGVVWVAMMVVRVVVAMVVAMAAAVVMVVSAVASPPRGQGKVAAGRPALVVVGSWWRSRPSPRSAHTAGRALWWVVCPTLWWPISTTTAPTRSTPRCTSGTRPPPRSRSTRPSPRSVHVAGRALRWVVCPTSWWPITGTAAPTRSTPRCTSGTRPPPRSSSTRLSPRSRHVAGRALPLVVRPASWWPITVVARPRCTECSWADPPPPPSHTNVHALLLERIHTRTPGHMYTHTHTHARAHGCQYCTCFFLF